MNSIAHAYSVIAFLLMLGCAFIGFPVSAFSQSAETAKTSEELADFESEAAVTALAQNEATVPVPSTDGVIVDNYPRENLPEGSVFNDFVVGPGRFSLELSPGQSKTVEIVVSNRMPTTKRFSFETEDMTGSDDPSQSVVLLGTERGPYTLKDYIKIDYPKFDLKSGQRARIPVTVSLPPDAEPGGRYGSLITSIVSEKATIDESSGAKPGSAIVSRIGTLFFVTTPGEVEQDLSFNSFDTISGKHFFTKGPINFGIVSENKGSVHTTPYGEVRIYNTLGNEVGFVELEPWFVMPSSLRLREISWDRGLLIGRYTAVAKVNRGYDDIVDEKTTTFWVIPLELAAGLFTALFMFFFILHFILTRFEFRRKGG
ncbi:MAG: hypothetical protein RLZZ76_513 [Candidatus Parcubacteria bacterium]|jgi:hypothetical protein